MIAAGLAMLIADVPASAPATALIPDQAAARLVLPAGTAVHLVTAGPIDSRAVRQGQRFGLTVAEDVMVGSTVVIPRGTAATGEVEAVSTKGMFGKAARLILQPLFIDVAGERVNLTGATSEKGKDGTAVAAITTAITPLGLIITGKSVTIPAGSTFLGRVRTDVALPAASAQAVSSAQPTAQ